MAVTTPAPRIGKTTGTRPRPANSEKRGVNAKWHMASEIAAGDLVMAKKVAPKRKAKKAAGLINGG